MVLRIGLLLLLVVLGVQVVLENEVGAVRKEREKEHAGHTPFYLNHDLANDGIFTLN